MLDQLGALLDGDPFGTREANDSLAQLTSASPLDPDALSIGHTSFLNRLDSLLTERQLEHGDRADVLLMVRWMKDLYLRVPSLAGLSGAAAVVDASRDWIDAWNDRKADYADYPKLLTSLITPLQDMAKAVESSAPGISTQVDALVRQLSTNDLDAIEKAHRDVLLSLQALDTAAEGTAGTGAGTS